MRTLSNLWTMLISGENARLDTVAVINEVEYTTITAPEVHQSLLSSDALTVGNCVAASLTFDVMTTNVIPKSAKVVIKCRVVDANVLTAWYEFGTFWVSKRQINDDYVHLECYDAMLKGNQPFDYTAAGINDMNWPKPMQTVLNAIASQMGVTLDSRTDIESDTTTYKCEYPGEMTLLDVMGYIGACNCGNWVITQENKLRLVPLDGSKQAINVPAVFGQITTAKGYTISGVTMVMDEEHVYSSGDDSDYVLTINPCPYACQQIVDDLYTRLHNFPYRPFSATNAIYDPAAELGDTIIVGGITALLFSETRNYDIRFTADAEAPGKDELEDEYPYPSQLVKMQNSVVALSSETSRMRTAIEQTQSQVSIIAENYVGKNGIRSAFAIDPSSITLTAGEDEEGNRTGTITMSAGTLIIEGDNFSVDENGHMECRGARIMGSLLTQSTPPTEGSDDIQWVSINNGQISGGDHWSSEDGSILFGSYVEDESGNMVPGGIYLSGDSIFFDTKAFYMQYYDSENRKNTLGECFSGDINVVTGGVKLQTFSFDPNTGNWTATIEWQERKLHFEKGLLMW